MELKDRLKFARKRANLTQAELAQLVGISQPTLSELERGLSLRSVHILKMAQMCKVDPLWLAEGIGLGPGEDETPATVDSKAPVIGDLSNWEVDDPLADDDCEIPYFREVPLPNDSGKSEVIELAGKKLRFSLSTLRAAGVNPDSAACARMPGHNMERLILDGSAICFDRQYTSIHDGEIYAFDYGGMLKVHYLYRLANGGIRIRNENRDSSIDEELTAEKYREEVKILGRVFWWSTVRPAPRRR